MFHQMKGLASDVDDLLTYISTVLLHSEISCFLLMDMGFGLDHGPQCLPCQMMKVLSWTSICTKVFRKINNILPRISLRAEEKLGVNVPVITKPCCSWHWWATSCPATLLLVWTGCCWPSHLASSMDKWNLVQMYQLWPSHLTTGVGGLLLLQQPCCWCRQVVLTQLSCHWYANFSLYKYVVPDPAILPLVQAGYFWHYHFHHSPYISFCHIILCKVSLIHCSHQAFTLLPHNHPMTL